MAILNHFKYLIVFIVAIQQVLANPREIVAEDGNKYLIELDGKYTWYESLVQCSSRNLRLAVLDTEEKYTALLKVLNTLGYNRLWINAVASNVSGQRKFHWATTGEEFQFADWKKGEPNGNGEENCVHLDSYKWNDNNCARNKFGYLCEENPLITNPKSAINSIVEFLCTWNVITCAESNWET